MSQADTGVHHGILDRLILMRAGCATANPELEDIDKCAHWMRFRESAPYRMAFTLACGCKEYVGLAATKALIAGSASNKPSSIYFVGDDDIQNLVSVLEALLNANG